MNCFDIGAQQFIWIHQNSCSYPWTLWSFSLSFSRRVNISNVNENCRLLWVLKRILVCISATIFQKLWKYFIKNRHNLLMPSKLQFHKKCFQWKATLLFAATYHHLWKCLTLSQRKNQLGFFSNFLRILWYQHKNALKS